MDTMIPSRQRQVSPQFQSTPIVFIASMIWNIVILIGSVALANFIFNLTEFANLGRPVQMFAGIVALLPGIVAILSTIGLLRKRPSGRYLAMALNFGGMVLAAVILLHLWGFFDSFENVIDSIMQNATVTLGFAIAYGLFWFGGRLGDENPTKDRLSQLAMLIGVITAVILLLQANIIAGIGFVLGTYSQPVIWGITVAFIICAILFVRLLRLGTFFDETIEQQASWQGWLMLAPNIIGFLVFFAGPLLLSLYLSFTNSELGQIPEVIGFENYFEILSLEIQTQAPDTNAQDALSFGFSPLGTISIGGQNLVIGAKDPLFWISLRNTLLFCLLLVPLSVIPALGLALILNSSLPGVKIFRAVYFIPSVAAVVGTALIWRWLYDPTIGYINYTISQIVDFLNSIGIGIADPQIEWLTGPGVVLISIVLLAAWQVVGYNTVLFLAGLQGIPKVLYEAATVDGANRWHQFRNVTLPMLAPTTFFVMITTIVTGLQVFNEPFTLFPSRPLPVNAQTSVFYLYERGFPRAEFGYASSLAWVLFLVIFGITLIQFRIQRNQQQAFEG